MNRPGFRSRKPGRFFAPCTGTPLPRAGERDGEPCGRVVTWRIIMHNWESVFGCSPFTFAGQSVWSVLFLYIRRGQIMTYNAMTERYEEITVCGKPALFTSIRIKRDTVPDGLYAYDVRHDDECRGIPCESAPFVHSK